MTPHEEGPHQMVEALNWNGGSSTASISPATHVVNEVGRLTHVERVCRDVNAMERAARIAEDFDRRRRLGLWFRVVDADDRDLLVDLEELADLLD